MQASKVARVQMYSCMLIYLTNFDDDDDPVIITNEHLLKFSDVITFQFEPE